MKTFRYLRHTSVQLKHQLRAQKTRLTKPHATRLHRALSWLNAAELQIEAACLDQAFINLWVGFNACFYMEGEVCIEAFLEQLVALDKEQAIYQCLWHEYSGSVKALIKNPYVFEPFWQAQRLNKTTEKGGHTASEWQDAFNRSSVAALNALSRKQVVPLMVIVLERLYVLRNQVLQGGATYQSKVNREQVSDGVKVLASVLPIMISIMLENKESDWGELAYPLLDKPAFSV